MTWTVETVNDAVDGELCALPPGMRARFARISELIAAVGLDRMGAPHLRHLTGRCGRCASSDRDGIARALFVARRTGGWWWSGCS